MRRRLVWYVIKSLHGVEVIIGLYVRRISEGMGKDSTGRAREKDTRAGVRADGCL
jgi:hypothetical protein